LTRARPGEGRSNVRVPVRSPSAWAAEHDLGGVRLMKIDVEGFELVL